MDHLMGAYAMVEGKTVAERVRSLRDLRSQPYALAEYKGKHLLLKFDGVAKAERRDEDQAVPIYTIEAELSMPRQECFMLVQDLNAGRTGIVKTNKETRDEPRNDPEIEGES